jgi:phosphate transport system substrate-binding protein
MVGTGTLTPLASLLASAWSARHGQPKVIVEPSIGSSGGIRAAADGEVDIGLVARPLKESESKLGLVLLPIARDAVVFAAHPSVHVDGVSSETLVALFSGAQTTFEDGTPATVFLRDRDDSAHSSIERFVPGLRDAREGALEAHRFRVLTHDDAMGESLAITPGSVGVYSLGALAAGHLPLKVIALDGVQPSLQNIENGTWKATRDLAFVARSDRLARVRGFLSFVAGPEGAAISRANGCLPIATVTP